MRHASRWLGSAAVTGMVLSIASVPAGVQAQSIGYEGVGDNGHDAGKSEPYRPGKSDRSSRRAGKSGKLVDVTPYIEIAQVVDAKLSPGNDVLTYTQMAAGLDATVAGRYNAASVSVRYEHQIGWGKKARNGDAVSGIARGYTTIVPGVTVEAGGIATQQSGGYRGSALGTGRVSDAGQTRIYSVYGGPSVATRAGDVDLNANYRAGFTKIDRSKSSVGNLDVFDKSTMHVADVEAGVAPGTVLPVGVGVGGSFYQEDISNLDQRVRDMQARAMVTVPVGRSVQAVAAIGYEDVEISARDAVRDSSGLPVVGSNGRYVTDKSSPRVLAYDVSGLTWDVAVMWRPSRRTSLSAHVGRRYGATNYGGTLSYAPDDRSQLSIVVYNNIAGFGGQLNRLIEDLPDDFEAVRDPITGDLNGCVDSLQGQNCFAGALGSLRSSTFRARGIAASYTVRIGRINAGLGMGYDQRRFIAPRGTVLASANGLVDKGYWLAGNLGGRLGQSASWATNVYVNWLSSNDPLFSDVVGYGATASYSRLLADRLQGSLAIGIDGVRRDDSSLEDIVSASALAALRYNF